MPFAGSGSRSGSGSGVIGTSTVPATAMTSTSTSVFDEQTRPLGAPRAVKTESIRRKEREHEAFFLAWPRAVGAAVLAGVGGERGRGSG